MVTLLGSLLGFFGALFPEILRMFREGADRKHEIAILSMQMEQERMGYNNKLEEIRILSDTLESQAIYKTYNTGIKWVDSLNGSVRPVLAYSFFILYAFVKIVQASYFIPFSLEAIAIMWSSEDQAIFSGIISFYFGQRAVQKMRK